MSLLFMSRPIKKEIVRNGLVLWLEGRDFYNTPPTSTWIDKSENNNNGVPSGFAYTSASGSDGNGKVVFDGVDDYMSIGNPPSLQITGELTLECIVKGLPQANKGVISKYNSLVNERGYAITSADDGVGAKARFIYQRSLSPFNSDDSLVSNSNIFDNAFHHIVCVFKPSQYARIYIDGNMDAEDTVNIYSSIVNNSVSVRIGKHDDTAYKNMTLKFIRVYNRALSKQEVVQNYKASK